MKKQDFLVLLNEASFISFKVAREHLKDKLVPEFRYDVMLNSSQDDPKLVQFDIYPEDNGKVLEGLTAQEVCELLCRKGKIPVWIDIAVTKATRKVTTFELLCAGRYSDDSNEYYYQTRGTGPFGTKSPYLPPGYVQGKKFRLKDVPKRRLYT